jgi:TfoX/Sxy family transcriptional regulator of competence genes
MPGDASQIFATIVRSQQDKAGVSTGTGFGKNPGLRIQGKIYAMVVRDELVVKLPRGRVEELLSSGVGKPFNAGKTDRVMKEWIAVPTNASRRWQRLVNEAREFVGGDA